MLEKTLRDYNAALCDGIKGLLGCDVVKSNITTKVPKYPYVSFSVTGIQEHAGTYADDGSTRYNATQVTYSWTVQSDKDDTAWDHVQRLHDWFSETGRAYLSDNGLTVASVGAITERDNMITIEYEYRKGFDVRFNTFNIVERPDEVIEKFEPKVT